MSPTPQELRHMEHMHKKMSYNRITDFIYAGNNLCCQTHFEKELLSKGITADISLEAEKLDNPQGVKYFFWFPWEEDTAPSQELIYKFKLPAQEAIEKVPEKRPSGHLNDLQKSFLLHYAAGIKP